MPSDFGLPDTDFEQWTLPQCAIVNDHSMLNVEHPLWLDALYFRFLPSVYYLTVGIRVDKGGEMYATRLAMQGMDSGQNCSAIEVNAESKAYVTGVHGNLPANHTAETAADPTACAVKDDVYASVIPSW